MSIVKEYYYNIECDVCGDLADIGQSHPDIDIVKEYMCLRDFKELGGKHYCANCWDYDYYGNIVTKDGRKFNGDTEKEIL